MKSISPSTSVSLEFSTPIWRRSRITTMRWANRSTSSSSEEMKTTASPSRGELGDLALDVGLRADVDAAGRLVEDEQLRGGRQPAREQDLLLVAAGQVAGEHAGVGRSHAESRDVLGHQASCSAAADSAQPAAASLHAEHDVLGHGQVADDALGPAVLGREGDPVLDRVARGEESLTGAPVDLDLSAVGAVGAVEQPDELGAARAEQSGDCRRPRPG